MGTIHRKFLGEGNLAGGATQTFIWNNPPEVTVLGYFAYARPGSPGLTGTITGEIGIVGIRHQATRTGDNPPVDRVEIDIKNFRSAPCGYAVYESWITGGWD